MQLRRAVLSMEFVVCVILLCNQRLASGVLSSVHSVSSAEYRDSLFVRATIVSCQILAYGHFLASFNAKRLRG